MKKHLRMYKLERILFHLSKKVIMTALTIIISTCIGCAFGYMLRAGLSSAKKHTTAPETKQDIPDFLTTETDPLRRKLLLEMAKTRYWQHIMEGETPHVALSRVLNWGLGKISVEATRYDYISLLNLLGDNTCTETEGILILLDDIEEPRPIRCTHKLTYSQVVVVPSQQLVVWVDGNLSVA